MSTDITQFDAKTDVTGNVTAPRCRLGSDTCNFEIAYKDNDPNKPLEMYVTLPNTYKGKLVTQTYRMRSIIEAIQEINRRTATFSCNTSFEYAKDIFDVNTEDPYNQLACNDHDDGLPAASGKNTQPNELTDEFTIIVTENGTEKYHTSETYPLCDILSGWEVMCTKYTTFNNFIINNSIDVDRLDVPSMEQVDSINGTVTVPYTPPLIPT